MTLLHWLPLARAACDVLGLLAAAFYYGTDFFPRGRQWWEGLPDAPPPDAAAVADMERVVVRAQHRAGGAG